MLERRFSVSRESFSGPSHLSGVLSHIDEELQPGGLRHPSLYASLLLLMTWRGAAAV
jgi:hypothetical protein